MFQHGFNMFWGPEGLQNTFYDCLEATFGARRAPKHPPRLFGCRILGPERPQNTFHDCLEALFWGPKGPKHRLQYY